MTTRERRTPARTRAATLLLLSLALAACGPFGRATPTPLPAVAYPHTVVAVRPVELVVDRIGGGWQFVVRCRDAGSFDEVQVVARGPYSEASYRSDLQTARTCPSDEPPALTSGIVIDGLRADERLTITLTVSQRSGNGMSGIVGERTYVADARGELHPATP